MPPRRVTNPPQVDNLPHIMYMDGFSRFRIETGWKHRNQVFTLPWMLKTLLGAGEDCFRGLYI